MSYYYYGRSLTKWAWQSVAHRRSAMSDRASTGGEPQRARRGLQRAEGSNEWSQTKRARKGQKRATVKNPSTIWRRSTMLPPSSQWCVENLRDNHPESKQTGVQGEGATTVDEGTAGGLEGLGGKSTCKWLHPQSRSAARVGGPTARGVKSTGLLPHGVLPSCHQM